MYIKKVFETEAGEIEFQANLGRDEAQFLLEFAINSLMQQGALPFASIKDKSSVAVQSMAAQ